MPDENAMPFDVDGESLEDEAADWCVRLNDTAFDPDEPYPGVAERNEAFLQWIRRSPAYYEAFLRIYEVHRKLYGIDHARQRDIAAQLAQAREEFANGRWRARESLATKAGTPHSRRRQGYRLVAALAAVALLSAAAYFAFSYIRPTASPNEILSTKIGEIRQFLLADGSHITLDTDSRVEVKVTRAAREVEVTRGGALFAAVHDRQRPFTTCAGGVLLADVGTEFAAKIHAHGVDLTVASGVVEVGGLCSSPNHAKAESAERPLITAGEHATIDVLASGLAVKKEARTPHQMDVALACYRGVLILEDVPLQDLLPQINRYLPRRLVLGEPALANVRYGGTVRLSVLEQSILLNLRNSYSIVPDPKRSTSSEVVLVPAPGHPFGGPY